MTSEYEEEAQNLELQISTKTLSSENIWELFEAYTFLVEFFHYFEILVIYNILWTKRLNTNSIQHVEQWESYMEQGNHNANPRKWIHWINFSQSSLWFFVYSCQYNITYPPSKECSFLGSSNSYNLTYYKKYHQYANQN